MLPILVPENRGYWLLNHQDVQEFRDAPLTVNMTLAMWAHLKFVLKSLTNILYIQTVT